MPAPKGNKNALKHGIYSSFIAVVDDKELKPMAHDNTRDELAYARVRLKHASQERDKCKDPEIILKWDLACRHWIEIIAGIISRNVDKRESETSIFTSLLDAVRAANDKQHVVR